MLNGQKVEINLGGNFDPVPMDKYTVQCVDVNLVTQTKFQSSEEEEVLNYKFAILDDKPMEVTNEKGEKVEGSTRGKFLWKRCRLAMNDRSWLGKLAKAAYGRALTKEEIQAFDAESIVGKQVDVLVEQKEKDEKIYVNITSFSKTMKPQKPMDESSLKKTGQVKTQATAPAVAPDADAEADKLIGEINEEAGNTTDTPNSPADDSGDEDVKELEAKLKAAKAKAAAAKKK